MDEIKQACEGMVIAVIIPFIATVVGFIIGAKFSYLTSWLRRRFRLEKENSTGIQKDVMEIKKTTIQVAQDWIEMTKLITKIQDDQSNFVSRLQSLLEAKSEILGRNITVSLEEEFMRNDQRFSKMRRTIETMQEDILTMKDFLQSFARKSSIENIGKAADEKRTKETVMDSFSQTDYEIKRRARESHAKVGSNGEYDASKLILMVKKCLADLMKDTKLHLSIDREEENRELQVILTKLAEDREDIKKTIVQAFSIAADQAKKNFEQFSHVGQDAMHYIAVLNDNTNKMLKLKLEETGARLNEILNAVNRQTFDIDGIRETLENIDGQFDEIFQRVEIGCQKNTEHCEEIAQNLEKTSSNWIGAVTEVEKMAKFLSSDTKVMKGILKEMTTVVGTLKQSDNYQGNKQNNEVMQYDATDSTTAQDHGVISQKQRTVMFIYSMIQSCWEKTTNMNTKVESGCETICKLITGLESRLRSLNESFEKLEGVIRNVDLENLSDPAAYINCSDADNGEVLENIVQPTRGDAGDGQQPVFHKVKSETLARKIQNVIAIDREVKMIEFILKRVREIRNLNYQNKEISVRLMQERISNITEESGSASAAANELVSQSLMRLESYLNENIGDRKTQQ